WSELSVNVIIIAVLALLVLVVLFAVFSGEMNNFISGLVKLRECPKDSKVVDTQEECMAIGGKIIKQTYVQGTGNSKEVKYCCASK
ncbi:MAG: hypothetical protein ACP5OZ_04745, partial [Candidatus Woesearchaeota archaeon]